MWLTLLACAPPPGCPATLWHVDQGEAQRVQVEGEFTGGARWDLEPVATGAWRLDLELPCGDYDYRLWVDGVAQRDPFAALTTWDGEAEWSRLRVPDCALPTLTLEHASAAEGVTVRWEPGRRAPGLDRAWATLDGRPVALIRRGRTLHLPAPALSPGKHTLVVQAKDRDGTPAEPLYIPLWQEDRTFDWEGALLYQVVIDRFADSAGGELEVAQKGISGRAGGDLWGVLAQLEAGWFDALGVDALWLSPVVDNPEGWHEGRDGRPSQAYHGYWPRSPDTVEPLIGGEDAARALVEAAHVRGMRVLLDIVPNHVHEDHPYAARPGWLHPDPTCICGSDECPWSEDIQTCWFAPYLPDLATEDPEVAAQVAADAIAWARRLDLDGFRVDAVPMMPRAATRELGWAVREHLERGGTPFYTVGETFTGAEGWADLRRDLGPFGLDGQLNFPLNWAIRDLLAWESEDAAALAATLARGEAELADSGALMAHFFGNHDMPRFLSEAAGQDLSDPWGRPPPLPEDPEPFRKLVMAQALVLALPGVATLYYGDELGLAGANDPDCRRPMVFGSLSEPQSWALTRARRLGQTRRQSPALRSGTTVVLYAEGALFALMRQLNDSIALLVLNASGRTRAVDLALPAPLPEPLVDAVEGEERLLPTEQPTLRLSLPAWTARLYVAEDELPLDG